MNGVLKSLKASLVQAAEARTPDAVPFARLVRELVVLGAHVVPRQMWTQLAYMLSEVMVLKSWEGFQKIPSLGPFSVYTNQDYRSGKKPGYSTQHGRSHTEWQNVLIPNLVRDVPSDKKLWVVPVSELLMLNWDSMAPSNKLVNHEFVFVTRLAFVGSYKEMLTAVSELYKIVQVQSVMEA